jgi:hypothetical protein
VRRWLSLCTKRHRKRYRANSRLTFCEQLGPDRAQARLRNSPLLQSTTRKGDYFLFTNDNGGTDMRTTILAYVIAVLGFVTICGGVYSFFDLWNARATVRHYAITIGMICGGFGLGGIAQTLRFLVAISDRMPH